MTEYWIIRRYYIFQPQITFQESMTLIQLDLPQDMKEEILEKVKMENLRTNIYLMIIILDLNLMESNNEEACNQEEEYSGIFYYKLNKIDN